MFAVWLLYSFINYSDFAYEITVHTAVKFPSKSLENVAFVYDDDNDMYRVISLP